MTKNSGKNQQEEFEGVDLEFRKIRPMIQTQPQERAILRTVATFVVALDGTGDFDNLEEAVRNLDSTNGGVIYVKDGTYTLQQSFTIQKPNVTIVGAGRSTIIEGAAAITDHIIRFGGPAGNDANRGRITNCFIRLGAAGSGTKGVILNADECIVDSNWIEDITNAVIHIFTSRARNRVSDNYIESSGSGSGGVAIGASATDNVIIGNVINVAASAEGISILGNNNVIAGNRCIGSNSLDTGIKIFSGATSNIIAGNRVSGFASILSDAGTTTVIDGDQYWQGAEISTPATPAANTGRFYVKDDGTGVSALWFLDDSGTEYQITGSGGISMVYAEDSVHVSGDKGQLTLAVRNDSAATTFCSANGDYSPIAVDSKGSVAVNDGGNLISIDDGAGSITVDGTFWQATQPVSGTMSISGAVDTELTTADLDTGAGTDTRAVVGIVGSASGGGQLIPGDTTNGLDVDVTRVSGNVTVVQSTATNLKVDASGVAVPVTDNGGSLTVDGTVTATNAANQIDDAAFTPATSAITMIGAELDDTLPDSVDEGDGGAVRMSANRNLYVRIRDNAGNERGLNVDSNGELGVSAIRNALPAGTNAIGKLAANSGVDIGDVTVDNASGAAAVNIQDGGNSITVDYATTGSGIATGALRVELPTNGTGVVGLNTGTNNIGKITDITTAVVPGTAATNLGKAEDAAHSSGDTGVMALSVYKSAETQLAGTDGDYATLNTDDKGRLYVNSQTREGRLTDNSQSYIVTTGDIIITTTGTNMLAFKSSATKRITIWGMFVSVAGAANFDFYITPTVSVAGTGVTPVNVVVGGAAATGVVEKTPVTTANGTQYLGSTKLAAGGAIMIEFANGKPFVIIPSETATYRLLLKGTGVGANTTAQFTLYFSEE